MHIKQVTIQGFKSYKNQLTFDPFSPKHNVIVGRNGSGKSNFFSAIRFVLGDAYLSLSKEERQSLLHDGDGSATITAFVEIVFDNADNRFPTGKPEVVLRRTVGMALDEFSLDSKSASKSDVMNLLESAGFSRSNPYYIVPQGRVTALTVAKDYDRLQLLKEIAGTRVYEQKRAESSTTLEQTDIKRAKINEVLEYIQERLTDLEHEKEELSQFQTLDSQRRSIEYTIFEREQSETNEKLEQLDESRRRDLAQSDAKREEYADNEAEINNFEVSMRDIKQSLALLDNEMSELHAEREQLIKRKTQLELTVKDLEDGQLSEQEFQARIKEQLDLVEQEIASAEQTAAECAPQYEALREQDMRAREQLKFLELEQENIHAKQARLAKFTSKSERDGWLNNQIADLESNLATRGNQIQILEEEKKAVESEVARRSQHIQTLRDRIHEQHVLQQQLAEEESKLKQDRDDATEKRKDLWREEAKLDSSMSKSADEMRRAERSLASAVDRATSSGLAAVSRAVRDHQVQGVYGPLYELFDIDERFRTAVEVAAGASLFHVVVDTDETATRLLEIMTREKSGTANPEYPGANDAIPLMSRLQFDPKFQAAFQQIFAGVIVCPNLEVAAGYSKSHQLTVVTLDGDRVDRRGALFGGYVDTRNSRLDAAKRLKLSQAQHEAEQKRVNEIKVELDAVNHQVTQILSDLQMVQTKKKQLQLRQDTMGQESKLRNEEESFKTLLESKAKHLEDVRKSASMLEKQLALYRNELASEPTQTLSPEEQSQLTENTQQIEHIKQQLLELSASKAEVEQRINALNDKLNNDLRRRRDELTSRKERVFAGGSEAELTRKQKELKSVTRKYTRLTNRLGELEREIEQDQQALEKASQALDQLKEEQVAAAQTIRDYEKRMERHRLRQNLLVQRKEDCNKNIRDLGVLPDDEEAFAKYAKFSMGKLLRHLHRTNEALQKFNHVNKKAVDQYELFTKQRDQLMQRKGELDSSAEAVRGFMESMDRRKDEAIESTFQQVAANFEEIFEQLVPAGYGRMVIKRRQQDAMEVDGGEQPERYDGVAIQVSFNSKSDESVIMQQLSGGQKSVVALALIFAIQKCDPAPFYLFDEIDANLDVQYRSAVANVIASMPGQFITTTFRPELLNVADKCYGVAYQGKISMIQPVLKEQALDFVVVEQAH
ncbi:RecF/RecN/SMC [Syncephalastrum racemosum]|uniref:Structural maintenance of chromosomes protein n=1 Tax=Syncephalastrum racemosum TaxID=13706 RepID=A0A1X2HLS2_SYNRA|nr:RecF/RecN/SMC [Syncephalastrum racemosum]